MRMKQIEKFVGRTSVGSWADKV